MFISYYWLVSFAAFLAIFGYRIGYHRAKQAHQCDHDDLYNSLEAYEQIMTQATNTIMNSVSSSQQHCANVHQLLEIIDDHLETTSTTLDPDIARWVEEIKASYTTQTVH